ncbi:MAG: hypothetical protein HY744_02750 [Deltaproteobacteria bacterium]|nr:hypothetical protein [Deltaproteobacteria bacterium]
MARSLVRWGSAGLALGAVALGVGSPAGCAAGGGGGDGDGTGAGTGAQAGAAGGGGSAGAGGAEEGGAGGGGGPSLPPGCTAFGGTVLAVYHMFFGDTHPDGTPNESAWKQYGFDLDGKSSGAGSTDLCQPYGGAAKADVYPDATGGIDNNFGKTVMPLFASVVPNLTETANGMFTSGEFTLLLALEGLGAQTDVDPLPTRLYGGATMASEPKFDGSDCWPVMPELLADPEDIDAPKIYFEKATLKGDVWESNGTATLVLPMSVMGTALELVIYRARLSTKLNPSHSGSALGQLGGVLDREELAAEVLRVAGTINPAQCTDPAILALLESLRRSADMVKDGPQDPGKTCDAISIGLGFMTKAVNLGEIGDPAPVVTNPCE